MFPKNAQVIGNNFEADRKVFEQGILR